MLKRISQISLINYNLHHFITKCDIIFPTVTKVYYKMCQVFIINCDRSITKWDSHFKNPTINTKCDIYYKMCRYNVFKKNDKSVHDILN